MKLLFCPHCNDIFNLSHVTRACECGKNYGQYINDIDVEISETAVLLGFANSSFVGALREHIQNPIGDMGVEFTAFVIPENAQSVVRRDTLSHRLSSNVWVDAMAKKIPTEEEEEKERMNYIMSLHEAAANLKRG